MTSSSVNSRLRTVLYMSEHPPSSAGGAPLIVRQHLQRYEQGALHVLCDQRIYRSVAREHPGSLLPCAHTPVANFAPADLRPRRVFGPIFDVVNLARIPLIKRKARHIIESSGVEAIFTVPWRTDFAAAAYQLARETGLPLYVFETDDWHAMNPGPVVGALTRRWHRPLLAHAAHLWVTSPQMAERYRSRFDVHGEFLFHFVDPETYAHAQRRQPPERGELRLVYTGAVNAMFLGALERLATWLNDGIVVNGRRVVLELWGGWCPEHLMGPGFRWRGLVPVAEVPGVLASADALILAVTFSDDPALQELVRTSLYTKTVDYLASGKPVICVAPPGTAEVDYFGDFMWVVESLDRDAVQHALEVATTSEEAAARSRSGVEFIENNHTAETMGERFLGPFRTLPDLTAA